MGKLFSYVIEHDYGFSPNPENNLCTLVHCKFQSESSHKNVVEIAEVGDWIMGTGGVSVESAGHGKIIYLMRVDYKIPFARYLSDPRFAGRKDCIDLRAQNQFALVSEKYYYFGKSAIEISGLPSYLQEKGLEKAGPSFRCDYPEEKIKDLVEWFEKNYRSGEQGEACARL